MNRSVRYFIEVIMLRGWVYLYFAIDFIYPQRKKRLQKKLIHQFKSIKINLKPTHTLAAENSYYHTYGYFDSANDFTKSLVKNNDGLVINPITTVKDQERPGVLFPAYYGLVCYNEFIRTQDKAVLHSIDQHAAFVSKYVKTDGSITIWQDYPLFGQKAPWTNGITQGIVASFLLRAHLLFPENGFDIQVQKILDFMLKDTTSHVLSRDNKPWLEEYPMNPPSMVLNGFMFSIIALLEYGHYARNDYFIEQASIFLDSMVTSLHRYLYPVGIKHNVYQLKFGNINYQALHTYQFYHLYKLTSHPMFLDLAVTYHKKVDWKLFCDFYNMEYQQERYQVENFHLA